MHTQKKEKHFSRKYTYENTHLYIYTREYEVVKCSHTHTHKKHNKIFPRHSFVWMNGKCIRDACGITNNTSSNRTEEKYSDQRTQSE